METRPRPQRGDLYWLDWNPAQGSEQAGRRPGLVVSNNAGNMNSPVVIITAVTSRLPRRDYPFQVRVEPALANGLTTTSIVHCAQLITVSKDRLGDRLGALSPAEMRRVDAALRVALGLP